MFTIIGGDGKEYGPVTTEQVRGWIATGRANLETKVKAEGSTEWRRLGDFPEFTAPAGGPPAIPSSGTSVVPVDDLADRGVRLGARVIDWVIAFIAVIPGASILGSEFMKVLMGAAQGRQPNIDELDMQRLGVGGLVFFAGWFIVLVIQILLLSTRGQSIGKVCTGLRVVRVADGTQAGFLNAWLLRECVMTVIGFICVLIPVIGALMLRPGFHLTDWCMIFRDDRRCLHDLIAGTQVVRTRK